MDSKRDSSTGKLEALVGVVDGFQGRFIKQSNIVEKMMGGTRVMEGPDLIPGSWNRRECGRRFLDVFVGSM